MLPENQHLQRYIRRTMPHWLRDDAAIPSTWEGGRESWEAIRQAARLAWEGQAVFAFVRDVADRNWRAHEAASGVLDSGREVSLISLAVIDRTPQGDQRLTERAKGILAAASRPPAVHLNAVLAANVESLARGLAAPIGVERQLAEAEAAVAAGRAEQAEKARQAERASVVIEVAEEFVAKGRRFAPGRQRISREVLAGLTEWAAILEGQAHARGHADPVAAGIAPGSAWPPYRVVSTVAAG